MIFCQTKIHQDDAPVGCPFDVAGFDVAMHNGARLTGLDIDPGVHVLQRIHHLLDPGQGFGFEQGLTKPEHDLPEIFAGHVVHHKILAPGRFNKVVSHARQVGVRQARKHCGLALKLFLRCWGGFYVFFDRNDPISKVPVGGQVDRTHATLTELLFDAITSEL
jgi:hypothetical protein